MAKTNQAPPAPPPAEDGVGQFTLPNEADFQVAPKGPHYNGHPARVVGLDYVKWAAAVISLDADSDRINASRLRLTRKGFLKIEGHPTVDGYPNPEVWVIPRAKYEELREDRAQRIKELVNKGDLSRSAITGSKLVEN
jgi:hypothetical protein